MFKTPSSNYKLILVFSLLILSGIFFPHLVFGQAAKTKELYEEGEDFFKSEDYKEAIYYFLELSRKGHTNANVQFKIGTCYIHIPGEEAKAIPFLEDAVKQITLKFKKVHSKNDAMNFIDALFNLGTAYRIDNQLGKALECYQKISTNPAFEEIYNLDIVQTETKICERAKIVQDNPLTVTWHNMGSTINTANSETNIVVSGDETVIAYLVGLKFYNAVYVSRKSGDNWLSPENINSQIISDGEFYPTALSKDGNELYLVKKDDSNSDIYLSTWMGKRWSVAKPLNSNINSSRHENFATITADGKTLYFSSNRRDSKGGFDIYKSTKDASGEWGKAENLGKLINSKNDEIAPSISADGKTLYFSSKGHFNMGGFDVFYVTLKSDGNWSDPGNLGFPINTTSDNIGFQSIGDGKAGYISRIASDGFGKEDIYKVDILGRGAIPLNDDAAVNQESR